MADPAPLRSNTTGLFAQLHLSESALSVNESDPEGGAGLGLKVGYGLSPLVTLYVGFDAAFMERGTPHSYNYGTLDLGGRFNFRSGTHALVPYLEAALSGQAASMDASGSPLTLSGAGLTVGGGITYFLSPVLALDGGLLITGGSFRTATYQGQEIDIDDRTGSARLTLGLSLYPFR